MCVHACVCVTCHIGRQQVTSLEQKFLTANPDYKVQYDTCFSKVIVPCS